MSKEFTIADDIQNVRACDVAMPLVLSVVAIALSIWLLLINDAGALGTPTALVFPPNFTREDSLLASASTGADILSESPMTFIMFVMPRGTDFLERADEAGALLALNSTFVALCGGGTVANILRS